MGRVISTALQFIDSFTRPSQQAIKSMNKMADNIKRNARDIQNSGKAISSIGSAMTKAITVPIAGVATQALKMSNDFENAMAKVGTIADTTNTPMKTLREQVIDLSNAVGVGVTDIAEAQYQAISAGVDTAASVNFVSTAVKAAKGGFTDTTTAVDGLTTVINAYGFEASKAADISDQMLLAQNFGKTSFGDMASSMGKVIPIASSLNVSTEELFGSIAVLTKNGIATSEAVTGLKAAYSNILKPSTDASKTAQQLGLNFSSSHLQSVGWAKFLDEIKEKTGGSAETMAKLFGSTEALNSVTVLAGKGSADFAKVLGQMSEATGMTETAYKKMLTPTERMNISFNKIKNSLIQFGTALTPAFEMIAETINKVGDKLNNLSEGQVNAIVKFAAIAAAIGPAVTVFGKIVTAVGTVQKTFASVIKIFTRFKGVIGVITSPAGIVIGVLAAIALAAFLIIKNWDQVKGFLQGVGNWFKNAFEKAGFSVEGFKNKFTSIRNTIGSIAEKIGNFCKSVAGIFKKEFASDVKAGAEEVGGILETLVGGAVAAFDGIVTAVDKGLQVFDALLSFFTGAFAGNWDSAAQGFRDSLKNIFPPDIAQGLTKAFDTALPAIKAVVEGIKAMFTGFVPDVKKIFGSIGTVLKGIGTLLKGIFSGDAKTALKGFKMVAGGILDTIGNLFKAKINAVKNFVVGALSTFLPKSVVNKIAGAFDVVAGSWDVAIGAIKKAMKMMAPAVKAAFGVIKGVLSVAVSTITSILSGVLTVFDGLITFISGVFTGNWRQAWEGVKSIFKGVFDTFAAICKAPINAVIGIINGAISGLNKVNVNIPDWVPGLGGKSFGINIPTIPQLYKGTDNWKGGMAMIHDRGGEIVDLPQGSRVYPHDKSVEMAWKDGERKGSGAVTINIQKLADNLEVRSDQDIDRIAEALAYKLKKIAFNTGTA